MFSNPSLLVHSCTQTLLWRTDAPIHTHPILANSIQVAPSCPPATYHHLEEGDLGVRTLRLMPPASGAHRCWCDFLLPFFFLLITWRHLAGWAAVLRAAPCQRVGGWGLHFLCSSQLCLMVKSWCHAWDVLCLLFVLLSVVAVFILSLWFPVAPRPVASTPPLPSPSPLPGQLHLGLLLGFELGRVWRSLGVQQKNQKKTTSSCFLSIFLSSILLCSRELSFGCVTWKRTNEIFTIWCLEHKLLISNKLQKWI